MVTFVLEPRPGVPGAGTPIAPVSIVNHHDEVWVESGRMEAEGVRSLAYDSVLIDVRAGSLCVALPASAIAQLGLSDFVEISVRTAAGVLPSRFFNGATLTIGGRSAPAPCIELPDGWPPKLGAIALDMLGLEPDLDRRELRVLPDDSRDTYITA